MTDHPGFIADIIANPEDDVPRLIYADWLDEHGRCAQASFIRTWTRPHNRNRKINLRGAILTHMDPETGQAWAVRCPDHCDSVSLQRGFIASVTLSCDAWLKIGPTLARQAPLERVTLSDKRPTPFGTGWWWLLNNSSPSIHWCCLPPDLFARLRAARGTSPEEARESLSKACLAWARNVPLGERYCPACGTEGFWRAGVEFEHERKCPACGKCWEPGAAVGSVTP